MKIDNGLYSKLIWKASHGHIMVMSEKFDKQVWQIKSRFGSK